MNRFILISAIIAFGGQMAQAQNLRPQQIIRKIDQTERVL